MRAVRAGLARLGFAVLVGLAALLPAPSALAAEWVQNFVQTELWSGPDAGAISFGAAPPWEYFQVVSTGPGDRLLVIVVRTQNLAYVDQVSVGPSGPPPTGWPGVRPPRVPPVEPAQALPPGGAASQATVGPVPGFNIVADRGLWPALQLLLGLKHTWTLNAFASTGTRMEWGSMPADAAGYYQPARGLVTFNSRWARADPRALAALIEHEGKHVADVLAGLDVNVPGGCIATEVNAFREEALTWGQLVGMGGKPDPKDDLELSLNYKLALLQQSADAIQNLIQQSPGYRSQCRV